MKTKTKLHSLLAALMITAIPLAACSNGSNNTTGSETAQPTTSTTTAPSATAAATPKAPEPITMKVLFNSTDVDMMKTDVYQEIIKRTGVTMDIQKYDEEKFKVLLAGGDLPDIIQVPSKYLKELVEGGNIIPLDDLVKTNGPDILKPVYDKYLRYSKKFMSNDTGKLYQIPVQIGPSDFSLFQDVGLTVRWDYYKELGAPEIKNIDDMVKVIADMNKKHPTTADGKKIYGVSIFNDWGLWGLQSMGLVTGLAPDGKAPTVALDVKDGNLYNQYTNPEHSAVWDTAYFLYKSNQAGILDPDAFVNKYNDIVAKATQGTILSGQATWPFDPANAELLKQGTDKGYMVLPLNWGYVYSGGDRLGGWGDKAFAITKNAKNPQRAMDLINFIASEEGSRLIASGIEGVHWEMVNGKPQMKADTVKLASAGGDPWKKTGIGMMTNQQGLGDIAPAKDGGIVNLRNTPEVYATQMNTLQKDYSDFYKVSHPAAIFKKNVTDGKVKTNTHKPQIGALPALPDDMKRISTKLDDMITKGIPKVVLNSKNDAEYKANQQALIDDLKKEGAEKLYEWAVQEFAKLKPGLAEFNSK